MDITSVAIAEGQLEISENENELVNPSQRLWKWKTIDDELRGIQ